MNKELIYRLLGAGMGILAVISFMYGGTIALWIGGASAVVAILIYLMRQTTAGEKNAGIKKMKSAIGLVIITIVIGILLYNVLANYLISRWLIEPRIAWIIISFLLPFFITAVWLIFQDILPGELSSIRRGSVAIAIVTIAIIGYSFVSLPNDFFDRRTGDSKFWIDDKTGELYSFPGYSPRTGNLLRRGTPADAEKSLKKPAPAVEPQPQPQQSAIQTRIVAVGEGRWTPVDLASGLWFDLHAAIDPDKSFWIKLEDERKFLQRGEHLYNAAGQKADNCLGKNIGNRLLLAADKGQGEFEILVTFWPKDPLNILDGKECERIE